MSACWYLCYQIKLARLWAFTGTGTNTCTWTVSALSMGFYADHATLLNGQVFLFPDWLFCLLCVQQCCLDSSLSSALSPTNRPAVRVDTAAGLMGSLALVQVT